MSPPAHSLTHSLTPLSLLLSFLWLAATAPLTHSLTHSHTHGTSDPARVLNTFTVEGVSEWVSEFELRNSDPRAQAEAFCATHSHTHSHTHTGMTAVQCALLIAEAEEQFFRHQWLLQSTVYHLSLTHSLTHSHTDRTSDAVTIGTATFNLYTGLGPVLQAVRFCHTHSLTTVDCAPIVQQARDTFYITSVLLWESEVEMVLGSATSTSEGVSEGGSEGVSTVVYLQVYDSLPASVQAQDVCLLYGIPPSECSSSIVAMVEQAMHPYLTTVIFTTAVVESETESSDDSTVVELLLYSRTDPVLAALHACTVHHLSVAQCTSLSDEAEQAYYTALRSMSESSDDITLRDKYSFPTLFASECTLHDGVDPVTQALHCCDRNGASRVVCESESIITTVKNMFFESTPLVSFDLMLSSDDPTTTVTLSLYSELGPLTQLIAFCRLHSITQTVCLSYEESVVVAYYTASGPLLLSIAMSDQMGASVTFNLYSGTDPVVQSKRFGVSATTSLTHSAVNSRVLPTVST